ncbi:inactive serine protease 54-like isoform X2 [Phyllobates terribilis]|uniref:inactive serine protease 54-like isoform X2 n=1 Tax=Phyllobates terribilis TaxID=111132 RepID=UPI003CCA788A
MSCTFFVTSCSAALHNHGSYLAGGAIISEFWIVTAPSAVRLREDLSVLVGSTELDSRYPPSKVSYAIHKVIIHEEFNNIHLSNDLMLLMTRDKIRFGRGVQPICFPNFDLRISALNNCSVSGWTGPEDAAGRSGSQLSPLKGRSGSPLSPLTGHSGSTSWCRLSVENMTPCPLQRTVSTECCIHRGLHGSGCLGTGGSPVSCQVKDQWLLAGVLSGAGMRPYLPVLYTRTSYYSHWISSRAAQAGRPFIPTISTVDLPQQHFRAAVKEGTEELLYDYYSEKEPPKTSGCSSRADVLLILCIIFITL